MPVHNTSAAASADHVDLGSVARGVMKKIPMMLLVAAGVGAGTAGVLSTMAPKYMSQAQLEVRGNGIGEAGGRPDKEAVGTHVRGLMSTGLALKVSQKLELSKNPDFNNAIEPVDLYGRFWRMIGLGAPKPGETDEDRVMQAYFKAVRAYQVRETRSIIVDCTTSDAKFSADCANSLADLYRDGLSGRAVNENADLRSKLAPQVERLAREAAAAEAIATEFRGKANLFQGGAQATQLKDQQLAELTAELTRASTVRGDAEARAAAAKEMGLRGMAAANPDVQKSSLIPRMEEQRVTLERQISELSATLLPGHPRMKQLTSELTGLQAQIRGEVTKVVQSLANDARIAADREAGVRRRLDDMKRTVVTSAPDTAKLAQLESDAKAKRTELDRLQKQYEAAASIAGAGVGSVEVEIVSKAYPSNEKVFPKIGTMAPLVTFAAFILALAGTLTRELVHGARAAGGAAGVAQKAHTRAEPSPSATPMPRVAASSTTITARTSELKSPVEAALDLAEVARDTRGFRVLVAPKAQPSGAEEATLALARALSSSRRVVLINWAGAGPAMSAAAGIANTVGTAQLLSGEASIEEAVQRPSGHSFDIIAAGSGDGMPIEGDSAAMVLDSLDELYDTVIVAAPTLIATDLFTALQGRFDAGVVLVAGSAMSQNDAPPAFLGFEVPDFPVINMLVAASSMATRPAVAAVKRPSNGVAGQSLSIS